MLSYYVFSRWAVVDAPCDQALALISAILELLDSAQVDGKKILSIGTFGHLLATHAPFLPDSFPDVGNIRSKWAQVFVTACCVVIFLIFHNVPCSTYSLCNSQISEPNRDVAVEKPLRFVAGLPCAVRLVASLHNLDENDLKNLRVQVHYSCFFNKLKVHFFSTLKIEKTLIQCRGGHIIIHFRSTTPTTPVGIFDLLLRTFRRKETAFRRW